MAGIAALANVSDLAEWLGETIDPNSVDGKRAAMCLRAASALVRKESGRTWLGEDGELIDPLPEDVFTVTLYCASRVFDNRNAQQKGGLDDWSEGWKVDEAGAYLTESEKGQLAVFRSGMGGLGSVSTTRGECANSLEGWVPTPTPGVEFPWY